MPARSSRRPRTEARPCKAPGAWGPSRAAACPRHLFNWADRAPVTCCRGEHRRRRAMGCAAQRLRRCGPKRAERPAPSAAAARQGAAPAAPQARAAPGWRARSTGAIRSSASRMAHAGKRWARCVPAGREPASPPLRRPSRPAPGRKFALDAAGRSLAPPRPAAAASVQDAARRPVPVTRRLRRRPAGRQARAESRGRAGRHGERGPDGGARACAP